MDEKPESTLSIACGECGGGVRMQIIRESNTHIVHQCPYGHLYYQPREATRRISIERNNRTPEGAA